MKRILFLFGVLYSFYASGQSWHVMDTGLSKGLFGVQAIAEYKGITYAGGDFTTAYGKPVHGIAKWNDTNWVPVNMGLNLTGGVAQAMIVFNDTLYVGGIFYTSDKKNTYSVMKFDGKNWTPVARAKKYNAVMSFGVYNGKLYAGGSFKSINGVKAKFIAQWTGKDWLPMDHNSINSWVRTIGTYKGELCVAGDFTKAGGHSVSCIAKWNGFTWVGLGSGFSGVGKGTSVSGIVEYKGELYAGGCFSKAGNDSAWDVAKWDGTAWHSVISRKKISIVLGLAVYDDNLFVGGWGTISNGVREAILKWNGTTWSDVNLEPNLQVNTFASCNNELYIGGNFTMAGGLNTHYIARFSDK